jgi:ribonucleoside-diphosphate reductase beta chain
MVEYYPEANRFADEQLKIFWTHDEVNVEKDVQDILTNMTEAEKHGVITTLKLFTLYESFAGRDYWSTRFQSIFPRPELCAMASVFSMFELAVHARFYNKINEVLNLNTDEFYNSYTKDETLSARLSRVDELVNDKDPLVSIGAFSMVEGAILYSSFAFLKHFQSQGKNKLLNINRGIAFSVRDENLHSLGGAWSFKKLKEEKNISAEDDKILHDKLISVANELYEHECRIIDMVFEKGSIEGITPKQLKHFVESRLNECLKNLGYAKLFDVKYNPISEWFYDGINGFSYNDFFSGQGNQYQRDWDETAFIWSKE